MLQLFCRYLIGGVFLMAAVTKIAEPLVFVERLELHSGLPLFLARTVGIYLPWLELTCGFCLVLGVAVREAALLTFMLLLLFLGYTLVHLNQTDCGCFLFPSLLTVNPGSSWLLLRNAVLLCCSLWVAVKA